MLLRFAVLVGGTHKARIIAILLVLHFGLAALNHFIEIGEIERDRQSLEAQFPDLGVACYDYIPWLIALSVTIFFAIGETFGVGFYGRSRGPLRGRAHLDHFSGARLAQGVRWSVGC